MESSSIKPEQLGMFPAIEMTEASNTTFFYRNKHKRSINYNIINETHWSRTQGPLIYAVTDRKNVIRYIGKWVDSTPLKSRWIRHNEIHHQESSRSHYLRELDQDNGPLQVWMIPVETIQHKLGQEFARTDTKELANIVESQLIERLQSQLSWNKQTPSRQYSVPIECILKD